MRFDDLFLGILIDHTQRKPTPELHLDLHAGPGAADIERRREVHAIPPIWGTSAKQDPDIAIAQPIQWRFAIEPRFISIPVRVRAGLRRGPRRGPDCSSFRASHRHRGRRAGDRPFGFRFSQRGVAGSRAGPACRAARGSARRASRGRGCAFLVIESRSKSELRSCICVPLLYFTSSSTSCVMSQEFFTLSALSPPSTAPRPRSALLLRAAASIRAGPGCGSCAWQRHSAGRCSS